jgi:hypothetical protein
VSITEKIRMSARGAIALSLCAAALLAPASASAQHSVATREQIAGVRRAAANFLAAELSGNGAGACAILNAPLRATRDHRSCAARWSTKLAQLHRQPGARARLRSLQRAVPSARVVVAGDLARIELPAPLLAAPNHLIWTEDCWMLEG